MHELYFDCAEAEATLLVKGAEIPEWISSVVSMPIVNGELPSEHSYPARMRPAA